ncbi:unnamed protein product [Owenia fusiformis]|uniref:Uncharacterized protein n=1 Tax=Owenia fusiformis TaxID=6347 RepID=A0A8J1UKU1_OWEFU|nr:unnamed protein product [Owenia fusiformis]
MGITSYIIATACLAILVNYVVKLLQLMRKRQRDEIGLKDFPGPKAHWLYGNLHQVTQLTLLDKMVDWTRQYKSSWIFNTGPFAPRLQNVHPDTLKCVMGKDPKDSFSYGFIRAWIGDGLLLSKGKKWFRNRRLLTPAFHFDILKPYMEVFSNSSQIMVNKWKGMIKNGNNSLDMFEHVSLHTLDSILKCAFGYESNCQLEGNRNPYIQCVYTITQLVTKRFRFLPYHNDIIYYLSPQGFQSRKAINFAHDFTKGVIKKRKQVLENKGAENGDGGKRRYLDFLDMLLQTKDEDGNGLTDQEIQDEVDTFMFEGHDTTASGISWFLYNLARHPEIQERCRQEVIDLIGDREHFTWDDMSKLPYLTMCLKESMRLHPPVPNTSRRTINPIEFPDGRIVPADTWVGIGIYAVHHNPAVWEDPETYDPERFNLDTAEKRPPHAFIPFSAGPRNCIGQHFAMSEMKICAGNVLRNFKLEVDNTKPVVPVPELILRSKGGLWLNITPL